MLPRPRIYPFTLASRRGGESIVLWPDHGQWMCVDYELERVLCLADGSRTLAQIALEVGAPASEVGSVFEVLLNRGLFGPPKGPERRLRIQNVTVNLTNRCNLSCAYCYNDRKAPACDRPGADLARALNRLVPLKIPLASILVLGGEPLLAFDSLLDLADGCASTWAGGMQVSTNGTCLTAAHAREIAKRPIEVQVSLDGATAEEHDAVRGKGTYAAATRGLRLLQDHGVRVVVAMVYTKRSIGRIEAFLDAARAIGVSSVRFLPLRQIGRGLYNGHAAPDPWAAFTTVLEVLSRRPDLHALVGRDYVSVLLSQASRSVPTGGCGVGSDVLFVDSDGSLYPCPNHVDESDRLGSLLDPDVCEALETSRVLARMRLQASVETIGACKACEVRRWCGGDCRGEVRALRRSVHAASPHCEDLKRTYLEAFWALARGSAPWVLGSGAVRYC